MSEPGRLARAISAVPLHKLARLVQKCTTKLTPSAQLLAPGSPAEGIVGLDGGCSQAERSGRHWNRINADAPRCRARPAIPWRHRASRAWSERA